MDSLTLTGVIATILGGIFALAAWWNSRQRRKHEIRLQAAIAGEPQRLHVKPMPSVAPVAPPPARKETRSGPTPVFKQVTPTGSAEPAATTTAEEQGYVWE
ncbi:MAG: hypothetical protein U1E27_02060 [Kiritimatiellia bacterium]|nr:hypothetical protein [Kiritimatiellia bacterium]